VLQSASFRISPPTPAETGWTFGLFPKFSTPVEKTVEIVIDPLSSWASGPVFQVLREGESEKYREIGPSRPVTCSTALEMAELLGAKALLSQAVEISGF
jgi:hypothetical protein